MEFWGIVLFSTLCMALVTVGTKNFPLGASAFVALLSILLAINLAARDIIAAIKREK